MADFTVKIREQRSVSGTFEAIVEAFAGISIEVDSAGALYCKECGIALNWDHNQRAADEKIVADPEASAEAKRNAQARLDAMKNLAYTTKAGRFTFAYSGFNASGPGHFTAKGFKGVKLADKIPFMQWSPDTGVLTPDAPRASARLVTNEDCPMIGELRIDVINSASAMITADASAREATATRTAFKDDTPARAHAVANFERTRYDETTFEPIVDQVTLSADWTVYSFDGPEQWRDAGETRWVETANTMLGAPHGVDFRGCTPPLPNGVIPYQGGVFYYHYEHWKTAYAVDKLQKKQVSDRGRERWVDAEPAQTWQGREIGPVVTSRNSGSISARENTNGDQGPYILFPGCDEGCKPITISQSPSPWGSGGGDGGDGGGGGGGGGGSGDDDEEEEDAEEDEVIPLPPTVSDPDDPPEPPEDPENPEACPPHVWSDIKYPGLYGPLSVSGEGGRYYYATATDAFAENMIPVDEAKKWGYDDLGVYFVSLINGVMCVEFSRNDTGAARTLELRAGAERTRVCSKCGEEKNICAVSILHVTQLAAEPEAPEDPEDPDEPGEEQPAVRFAAPVVYAAWNAAATSVRVEADDAELPWKARVVGDAADWLQLFDADAEPCDNEPEGAGPGKFIAAAAEPEAGAEARSAEIELLVRDGDAWTRVDVCSFIQGARGTEEPEEPDDPDEPEEPEEPTLAVEPTRLVFSPLGGSATLTASGSDAAQATLSIPAEYADAISAEADADAGGTWTLTAPAAPDRTRKISFFAALTAPGAAAAVEIVLLPFPRAARTLPTEPFFREQRLNFFTTEPKK